MSEEDSPSAENSSELTAGEEKLYRALLKADEALYEVWKQLPLDRYAFQGRLYELQKTFIQPEITRLKAKAGHTI